jgi:hypothetical protein
MFRKIFEKMRTTPPVPGRAVFRGLQSPEQFQAVLKRERARSDRSGDPFSLLSLGVKDWESGRTTLVRLARLLRRRLRATDEAGWIDSRHIGIAMP